MGKKSDATPEQTADEEAQVSIRLTQDVHLEEWHLTLRAGQITAVQAKLLADPRFAGKFERV